jgi:F-type H+-transporting ATPase subunit gamma
MPSLIDFRRRIRSVKNTQQITKAMKMVSAAKLRRAQDRVIAARPTPRMLREMLANLAAAAQSTSARRKALAGRANRSARSDLVTSDKGLAGAFNSNLIKARSVLRGASGRRNHADLVGRKGRDFSAAQRQDHRRIHQHLAKPAYADAAPSRAKVIRDAIAMARPTPSTSQQRIQERDDADALGRSCCRWNCPSRKAAR